MADNTDIRALDCSVSVVYTVLTAEQSYIYSMYILTVLYVLLRNENLVLVSRLPADVHTTNSPDYFIHIIKLTGCKIGTSACTATGDVSVPRSQESVFVQGVSYPLVSFRVSTS